MPLRVCVCVCVCGGGVVWGSVGRVLVVGLILHRGSWKIFFAREIFLCTLIPCLFHPCVTAVACKKTQSSCQKSRWQVTSKCPSTLDPVKLEWADYAVQAQCRDLSGKQAHMQLIRGCLSSVLSAHLATMD